MTEMQKAVLILRLIDALNEKKSWCGNTHIQKTAYFLQKLLKVPLDFQFVMYRHGPFSFDLRDELTSLRADNLVSVQLMEPYGPSFLTTELGRKLQNAFPKTIDSYKNKIAAAAIHLGQMSVVELERLSTTQFVTLKSGDAGQSEESIVKEVIRLKPHITEPESREAIHKLKSLRENMLAACRG